MIAKQTRGNRMRGLVAYLFGPGRHEEHRDPRLVAAWEPIAGDGRLTPQELADLVADLDAPRRLHGTEVKGGHVWQCSLRNADDDRVLSDAEWGHIAEETITRLGFDQGCRWIAVRHAENHIHLAVSLVREDGRVASLFNDRRKLSTACADFERRYGLQVRAQRGAGMPGLTRAELERPARLGHPEPARTGIARKIRAAAAASRSEAEFLDRARAQGLLLRPRWAAGDRREVVGYSVAVRTDGSEPLLWFGGGRLAPDLTLPRLRRRWPSEPHAAAEAWAHASGGGDRSPRRLRQEAWAQAAHVVDDVRGRLAAVPAADQAAWAAAAGEAAGALSAIAGRVEGNRPGQLSRAADELTRAAQLPVSVARLGQPSDLLVGMAGVVRTAADAAIAARGGQAAVAVLLAQLGRLIRQIEQANAAAARAEQARRAHHAADQLLGWLHQAQQQPDGDELGRVPLRIAGAARVDRHDRDR